jgi:hypothetical protein
MDGGENLSAIESVEIPETNEIDVSGSEGYTIDEGYADCESGNTASLESAETPYEDPEDYDDCSLEKSESDVDSEAEPMGEIEGFDDCKQIDKQIEGPDDIKQWLGDINPKYDPLDGESPYNNNCGSCAYAVEQRLNGDTDVVAAKENIGYNSEMEEKTGLKIVEMSPAAIQEHLVAEGPGAHGIVGVDWKDADYGHWFNAYYDGKKIYTIDGQSGKIYDWPHDYIDISAWCALI